MHSDLHQVIFLGVIMIGTGAAYEYDMCITGQARAADLMREIIHALQHIRCQNLS
jgi:hypothetical protein